MQRADDVYRPPTGPPLFYNSDGIESRSLGEVVDLAWKIFQDNVAHLLRLRDRAQLRRQKHYMLALRGAGNGGEQHGGAEREAEPGGGPLHRSLSRSILSAMP